MDKCPICNEWMEPVPICKRCYAEDLDELNTLRIRVSIYTRYLRQIREGKWSVAPELLASYALEDGDPNR